MSQLILIPARKGSKGLKNKNILPFRNKPLIMHTVESAKKIPNSIICVSSDSIEIRQIVKKEIDIFIDRPKNLSTDKSSMNEVINHALLKVEKLTKKKINTVILLQPTSPLRSADHIIEALKLYYDNQESLTLSVSKANENPYYTQLEIIENKVMKVKEGVFERRQECPKVYNINGAIYIFNSSKFLDHGSLSKFPKQIYEMPKWSSIDIDDEVDFFIAEKLKEIYE